MFSVNTNLGAMAALSSLNSVQSQLKETQNEISTGSKISSASDNPAVYAIAQTMKANVAGLTAVSDSLSFGASVVGAAQAATTSIGAVLTQLKNTITQGQTTGMDPATVNASIKALTDQINGFAQGATFNGVNLTATTGTGIGATSTTASVVQNVGGSTIKLSTATAGLSTSDASGLGLSNLTVATGGMTIATSNATLPVAGNALNIHTDTAAGAASTTYTYQLATTAGATTFSNAASGTQVNREVLISATDSTASIMTKLSAAMAQDGFSGTTDSSGALNITGNNVQSSGANTSVSTLAGATTIATIGGVGASSAIATVDAAIKQLNANSSYLGSVSGQITGMQSFTTALSSSVTAGIGALTDADMAAESAKLQSLQTKQSLAIQSLSIANQQPQAIMTLFR